jgi:hypothetical protein
VSQIKIVGEFDRLPRELGRGMFILDLELHAVLIMFSIVLYDVVKLFF